MQHKDNENCMRTRNRLAAGLLTGSLLLGCGCTDATTESPPVGVQCEYQVDTGYVKVIGFGDTVDARVQMVFNFYSNRYVRLLDAVYPDTSCIKANSPEIGSTYRCTRSSITKGGCVPVSYAFDSVPCFNRD